MFSQSLYPTANYLSGNKLTYSKGLPDHRDGFVLFLHGLLILANLKLSLLKFVGTLRNRLLACFLYKGYDHVFVDLYIFLIIQSQLNIIMCIFLLGQLQNFPV